MPSQAAAAAVTDDVSFTAVPANRPKPSLLMPSMAPSEGKISAAMMLKRKMTLMAWAISSSSASMTGAVAANCGAAADRGAHTHERRDLLGDVQRAAQHERDDQRRGDGREDDGQGASAHLGDFAQVEAEAQQDHRVLQDLLRRVLDARRGRLHHVGAVAKHQAERHADEDGEDRPADDLELLTEQPMPAPR